MPNLFVQIKLTDNTFITLECLYLTILQPTFVSGASWIEPHGHGQPPVPRPPPPPPDEDSLESEILNRHIPNSPNDSFDLPPLPPDAEERFNEQARQQIPQIQEPSENESSELPRLLHPTLGRRLFVQQTPEELLDAGIEQIIEERRLRRENRSITHLQSPFEDNRLAPSQSTTVQPSISGQEELLDPAVQELITTLRQRPPRTPPLQHTPAPREPPPRPTRPLPLQPTVVYPNRTYTRSRPSLDTIHREQGTQVETSTPEIYHSAETQTTNPTPESLTEQLVNELFEQPDPETPTPRPNPLSRIRRGLSGRLHRNRHQSG